ncbi:hypothetical protein QUF70_11735 [Desulfobacterales bacterium HSG17]|nr:hypothetical protein [Desulfobacterales bacterium HSG17]
MKKQQKTNTRWHLLLGRLLEELLTSKDILVYTDVAVMNEPPRADLLLLKKQNRTSWTEEQKAYLPDGIRDTHAKYILLEFKYTESVNDDVFRQTLSYDYLYRRSQKLKKNEIKTFIISAKTTRSSTLEKFGYFESGLSGVWYSKNPILEPVSLLSLNDLSIEPHNAYIKCFASRKNVKKSAFEILMNKGFSSFNKELQWCLEGLLHYWFNIGGKEMELEKELTPAKVIKIGKKWQDAILSGLNNEERLEVLSGLKVKDRLKALSGLPPQQVLSKYSIKDRLAGLSVEEIEDYLKTLKNN